MIATLILSAKALTIDETSWLVQLIASLGILSAFIYGFWLIWKEIRTRRQKSREEYMKSFDTLVAQLTSDRKTSQLSAAILLRRYFKETIESGEMDLRIETINVISSLLRTLRTSVFQKTLADGFAYAKDLSQCDLQKTNLQDALLGSKHHPVFMNQTDLYLADLSYANMEGVTGHGIILYHSILFCTRFKECDFTDGNFRNSDLTGVSFKNCILKNADFTDAINIPPAIKDKLVNGRFTVEGRISAKHESKNKSIFFSMPGIMSKEDELMTKDFRDYLDKRGFDVIFYKRDDYPQFGQFNKVRHDIMRSCGMVAFGLKQLDIHAASYRPGTQEEEDWKEKWLSTPWSEIEVGMGLMKGMPILLVCDPNINSGVFDKGLSECFVATISTTDDCRKLDQNKNFYEWLSRLD